MARVTTRISLKVRTAGIDKRIRRIAAVEEIIERYADLAVELAKAYARVDTGAMRDSIKKVLSQTKRGIEWRITIGEGLPDKRAWYNEYGTAVMAAQPMIRPALEQIREPMMAEIRAVWSAE